MINLTRSIQRSVHTELWIFITSISILRWEPISLMSSLFPIAPRVFPFSVRSGSQRVQRRKAPASSDPRDSSRKIGGCLEHFKARHAFAGRAEGWILSALWVRGSHECSSLSSEGMTPRWTVSPKPGGRGAAEGGGAQQGGGVFAAQSRKALQV